MTTSRIKQKVSAIVSSQLPEFVRSDYTTFVDFLEAYYRFLEQDQKAQELIQNGSSYRDIDTTADSFVQYFLKTYVKQFPESALVNKRLLVKKIYDLYESKGTDLSFKLLFRILFDESVQLNYPYENVLRASDGRWEQRFSIRIQTVTGNASDLDNRILSYTYNGLVYETPIVTTKFITSTLTEVFLNPKFLSPAYVLGDAVSVSDSSGVIFTGIIKPTTVRYSVLTAGSGFKVGQIYNISYTTGVNTLVKISGVNSTGGITKLKFINYGHSWPEAFSTFTVDLDPAKNVSQYSQILTSSTGGFSESGSIVSFDPTSPNRYFDTDYTTDFYTYTDILRTFGDSQLVTPAAPEEEADNLATILFELGALGTYPGYFATTNGFLSEPDIRLQNNLLYQPFAYQTSTNIDIEEFYDVVKALVHPAGQNLFNNRSLTTSIDVSDSVILEPTSNVGFEALSTFGLTDNLTLSFIHRREFESNATTSDSITLSANLILSDQASVTETLAKTMNLVFSDNLTVTEEIQTIGYLFEDAVNMVDQVSKDLESNINNITTLTDTIEGIVLNYDAEIYFSEVYCGEKVI